MPETKMVQILFMRHFVTPPTKMYCSKYKRVIIEHNVNTFESLLTMYGLTLKLNTKSMMKLISSPQKKLNYIRCIGVITPTHFHIVFNLNYGQNYTILDFRVSATRIVIRNTFWQINVMFNT